MNGGSTPFCLLLFCAFHFIFSFSEEKLEFGSLHISVVMTLFSSLTPVFLAIICVLIGVILKKTNREKEKGDTRSKTISRPWVDEDLRDGTDHHLEEEGKKNLFQMSNFVA